MIAHGISGLLTFGALAAVIVCSRKVDVYLVLLFAIAIGVHGISHLLLEKEYKFNPFKIMMK
jgi:hypothetical protein